MFTQISLLITSCCRQGIDHPEAIAVKRKFSLSYSTFGLATCDFYLDAWDPTVDGPFPELDSDFLPDSDKQGKEEEETKEEAHVEFHPRIRANDESSLSSSESKLTTACCS